MATPTPCFVAFISVLSKPPFCRNIAKGKDLSDFEKGFMNSCYKDCGTEVVNVSVWHLHLDCHEPYK